jgi:redox-regulated HSP33 family molecular chaperone
VEYGEYGFWTRDTYLSSWLTALLAELRKTTKPQPWHKPLMEHWSVQVEVDGGCMSAALDEFLTDSERLDSLISTSELALRNCELSAKRTGELFVALLRGTLKTTASSPIDYLGGPS